MTPAAELEREVERLYGLPLEQFTPARNALAKELRARGEGERAEQVKRLAKPSLALWVVNQLARRDPTLVAALLEAGQALREAQEHLLAGAGTGPLDPAVAAEREALSRLASRARALLAEAGRPASAATLERITATLRAAATDPEARPRLERGTLREELGPAGFDAVGGLAPPKPKRSRERPPAKAAATAAERRQRRELRELRSELRRQEAALRAAESEAERAEAAAAKARAAAAELRTRVEITAARIGEFEL